MRGTKTQIDVKDIFKSCKNQIRKVLVSGVAGVGKSTFCQYLAYQWATGALWTEYGLVVLIPLQSLTEEDYRHDMSCFLVDILKKQYFFSQYLPVKDERYLKEHMLTTPILWLLDGYDEIAQNKSEQIKRIIEQLLHTSNHILTSRPYMNTLPYDNRIEIEGFADENISTYIKQFFGQTGSATLSSPHKDKQLLEFLKRNFFIRDFARVPLCLELICSIWDDTDWSKTETITMTILYNKVTEWICRRYLEKKSGAQSTNSIDDEEVYKDCKDELIFSRMLAFHAMKENSILLTPQMLKEVKEDVGTYINNP